MARRICLKLGPLPFGWCRETTEISQKEANRVLNRYDRNTKKRKPPGPWIRSNSRSAQGTLLAEGGALAWQGASVRPILVAIDAFRRGHGRIGSPAYLGGPNRPIFKQSYASGVQYFETFATHQADEHRNSPEIGTSAFHLWCESAAQLCAKHRMKEDN